MKMKENKKLISGLGMALLLGATAAFSFGDSDAVPTPTGSANGIWHLEATGVRIIGGYGNNFAYDGENVRPLEGRAEVQLDTRNGTGTITIEVETTRESGPIRFSSDQSWSGRIRLVQQLNTKEMAGARIAEEVFLHGDTGNEAPVMPNVFNYFATWGPSRIWVNGTEVVPMIGSHTMFSEQARGLNGRIENAAGEVYSPMAQNKGGFTDRDATEFHYVAHTTQPDQGNFPPHTGWIHLQFSEVTVVHKPEGVSIPYTQD
ncbi:MAG: hypothetical protein V3T16_06655 [Gemmatimonadales bacterium]